MSIPGTKFEINPGPEAKEFLGALGEVLQDLVIELRRYNDGRSVNVVPCNPEECDVC